MMYHPGKTKQKRSEREDEREGWKVTENIHESIFTQSFSLDLRIYGQILISPMPKILRIQSSHDFIFCVDHLDVRQGGSDRGRCRCVGRDDVTCVSLVSEPMRLDRGALCRFFLR